MQEYDVEDEDKTEDYLTDDFVRRVIEETIEFDKKMQDPEFLRKIRIEEEKIRSIDLEALIEKNKHSGDIV